jgi:hypothetical protein
MSRSVTRPVVVGASAVFAGLAWLLAEFPTFDASVWTQTKAVATGGLLGGLGAAAALVVVGVLRDTGADVSAMVDPAERQPVWWSEPRLSEGVDR